MSHDYLRLPDPGEGLRLHLNENTNGCSPRVLEALRAVSAEEVAFYPDYDAAIAECAAYFKVPAANLLLTNGLDEGILAAAVARLRGASHLEAIIVEPTFDMYAACADAAGGRIVAIAPRPDFEFPLEQVLAAVTDATRLIFLTNPNNPTGLRIPREALRAIATSIPDRVLVFLDEAYADFSGETFLGELPRHPNIVVGRTFAKAYGLAAARAGVLFGDPSTLAPLRRVVQPYSVNVFAVTALRAALQDSGYVAWYAAQVAESRRLLYDACARHGLRYWPSAANFVLVRVGARAGELVERMAARRIFVRNRSAEPGCEGCVRITTGVVEHTRRAIAALEEVLCDVR